MKVKLLSVVLATASLLVGCGGGMEATIDAVGVTASTPDDTGAQVLASVVSTSFYLSPSQVRTRYGFDALPNTSAAKGSGQLIAVISAYNNPDLAANLAAFSAKYNLPQCATVPTVYTIGPNGYYTANVANPAPGSGCTIQVVNVDSVGHPSKTKPQGGAATAAWAMESSMDIEWAHAIAPMASILVVQAPNNFPTALSYAASYASNEARADVVSMSWGMSEDAAKCLRLANGMKADATCDDTIFAQKYWQGYSKVFTGPATYVAASGDLGKLQWPAISNNVLAVGGTTALSGGDIAWTGSGGGVSMSFPANSWQTRITGSSQRNVPDVAYAAGTPVAVYVKPNSNTGYPDTSCVAANGAANCGWYGGGGTSAGAPQWAGIVAITNAMRESNGMGQANFASMLYDIASVPGNYTTMFTDVLVGSNAKAGYDTSTGLGVPQASNMIAYLAAR